MWQRYAVHTFQMHCIFYKNKKYVKGTLGRVINSLTHLESAQFYHSNNTGTLYPWQSFINGGRCSQLMTYSTQRRSVYAPKNIREGCSTRFNPVQPTYWSLQVVGLPDQVVQPVAPVQHLADVVRQDNFHLVDLTLHVVYLRGLGARRRRLLGARVSLPQMTTPVWSTRVSGSHLRPPGRRGRRWEQRPYLRPEGLCHMTHLLPRLLSNPALINRTQLFRRIR